MPVGESDSDKLIDEDSSLNDSSDEPEIRTRRHPKFFGCTSKTSISTFSSGETTNDDGEIGDELSPTTGSSNLTSHSKTGEDVTSGDEP